MNSTVDNSGSSTNINFNKEDISDVAYSIGFSILVLVVLVIVSYISYKCNRSSSSSSSAAAANSSTNFSFYQTDDDSTTMRPLGGLDEATLVNYPKLLYSQAKPHKREDSNIASGCSICLADYKETDMLRLLPECGHIFHLRCIDPWLKLHPTCPICRSSPMPTPLAEVVPLSLHQNSS